MDSAISAIGAPALVPAPEAEAGPALSIAKPGDLASAAAPRRAPRRGPAEEQRIDGEESLRKAAEALQEELKSLGNLQVRFSYDEEISRYVVEFIDPEEDEVVRQVPPEALLTSIRRLREVRGMLFDQKS